MAGRATLAERPAMPNDGLPDPEDDAARPLRPRASVVQVLPPPARC